MKVIIGEWEYALPMEQMSEEEFYWFCAANPDQPMERDKNGNIFIMAPTNFESGSFETAVIAALSNWNQQARTGYVLSSSTGFTLPNGAVRSPDAAWVSRERMNLLPESEKKTFAHICPDFVIEIRSKSDRIQVLKEKMQEYIENGAQLGFLIAPYERMAIIYRANGDIQTVTDFDASLSGEQVLPGFELPLSLFHGS